MATPTQNKYITDLAVIKTKEFKEVKELLVANQIVGVDAQIVADANTLDEIINALDTLQASKLIDVLTAAKEPARATTYAPPRFTKMITGLDDIKKTIDSWDFS